ncbi:MAG: PD40 domain-containing protein [Planctomycetes bacterium]|nr:PD40 domain-containing protein [Planctomycetota bacterium]
MAKLRASVRFPRDIALGAALLLTACSSGSGAPAGGGNNNTGGTPPPPPTGFAVFTSSRTIANVYEPWIASYDGADLRPFGAVLPDGGAVIDWGARLSADERHLAVVTEGAGALHYAVLDLVTGTAVTLPFADAPILAAFRPYFVFSPDGTRLLLTRLDYGLGKTKGYVMDADGTNLLELPFGADHHSAGLWSPTSEYFVCAVQREAPLENGFYLFRADGSTVLDLIPPIGEHRHASRKAWSADGSRLSFEVGATPVGGGDPFSQVWVYDIGTMVLAEASPASLATRNHGLSAGGATVAWSRLDASGTRRDLYVGAAVGGGGTLIGLDSNYEIEWAPVGDHLAYRTFDAATSTIRLHASDSAGTTRRLDVQAANGQSTEAMRWAPDGRWLAFSVRYPAGQSALWVVDVEAPDPAVRLTDSMVYVDGRLPRWSPDGRWLYAFETDALTQREELHAWPTGDWAAMRSLGEAEPGSVRVLGGPSFAEPFDPTPDSRGVVWRRRAAGATQVDILYGRPDDPGNARILSSAPAVAGLGAVRQVFAR